MSLLSLVLYGWRQIILTKGRPMKRIINYCSAYAGILALAAVALAVMAGCEQPKRPGETYHKLATAWPIFDLEKWEGEEPDGTKWEREKGDAICWLSTWEKEKRYDKDGYLIYTKENNSFFPLYSTKFEESPEFIHKEGTVLIFPYISHRVKTEGE